MSDFLAVMSAVFNLFRTPMNIYGFTFSLWDVMMTGLLLCLIGSFVGGVLRD